jgi:hypothetical protein
MAGESCLGIGISLKLYGVVRSAADAANRGERNEIQGSLLFRRARCGSPRPPRSLLRKSGKGMVLTQFYYPYYPQMHFPQSSLN